MSTRSSKKGPYVDPKLLKKVLQQKESAKKMPIKTWARASQVAPEFVGHTFAIHNGRVFTEVFISEDMVGYRLGEFAPTRTFRGHGKVTKRVLEKT
ncbi:MAG: Ribosomal protein S19 [Microgenomates group bacterium GW2011_GWC1_41_8]|uniref:Small ribosomal subunit protein uS19 n=3 Tax=Candidatus Roizmaniibacteriota TaxID=1752723 RepID=A0A0G1A292_9BACT|nr:MAG: Ribosomal protein S19 [Candidatus Roizmanbacteria bacterium GW2011_GWB1_40_7]KKR94557.1 MAG: Ribosomal protein S19 [Candidatus Roizmanbacteria bacterium GW2011_GWA1_41_13]KKS19483.1 MAG: Ribosomal protein S19 [Candidatus Roizmanbacteria bacterium GW2011_GWC2_41_7]KKS24244.1 MAG: Ribosomal protein S19 [Microgenomates group bacterium GW2011_GWC1_41_8]OGK48423.1 MAG: 30S ribosomal protein S19 [Candidatus Roizmanbacteria bacterium RIFCSPLOWO2_01_FULL_40_14]